MTEGRGLPAPGPPRGISGQKNGATRRLERRLGDWARGRLPAAVAGTVMFLLKQGWAALFGGLMLTGLIASKAVWESDWAIARYDALLIWALGLQVAFLALRLESPAEARVILLFHLTGTAMELFKTAAGSWSYPCLLYTSDAADE